MEKKALYEEIAEQLIEQLKQGTSPLQRVWAPGEGAMPYNPTTGKRYRGGNSFWLSMQGRSDPRWLTYKQAQAEGAQVRKGEKSTTIEYWKFREDQVKKGADGNPVLDAAGNKIMMSVELERPKVFYAKVFNAEQIDGMPPLERREQTWNAIERAERIVAASGARIKHEAGDRAFYRPSTDSITLPEKGQFPTAANYYAVQMHELGHWTGHPSRLDRDLSHPFGSEGYAREELRAEVASMMLGAELGLGRDPGQHAAYVGSWIKVLEDDPRELFRAAADAEKIQQFILAFEQVQEVTQMERIGHEQADVLRHLAEESSQALAGYRSIESWENLENAANTHGLRAVLRWSSDGNEASPLQCVEGSSDIYIQYFDTAGKELPIHSEMNSGDGKAITCIDGRRVSGTGFTSDDEWQRASLATAVATLHAREQQAVQGYNVEHTDPKNVPENVKVERWILERLGDDLNTAVARMSQSQADTTYGVLEEMHPLGNNNPFWLRHPEAMERMFNDPDGVEAAIFSGKEAVIKRGEIISEQAEGVIPSEHRRLVEALHTLRTYQSNGDFDAAAVYWEESGFAEDSQLPSDWTGGVRVNSNERGGFSLFAERDGRDPIFGRDPSFIGDFETEDSANDRADEYRMIDAYGQLDPLQVNLKLALAKEITVARNSQSSAEEVADAKEARKSAGIAVTLNSDGMRERIDALEEQVSTGISLGNFAAQNTWLAVPFEEREQAKRAAGRLPSGKPAIDFDGNSKCWYARPGADLDKLREWLPQNRPVQARAESPEDELATAMREMGLVVEGEHPIIDGAWHRVPVQGASKGNTSGAYKAYPVKNGEKGVPAGTIQNHRTGAKANWKAKGYVLSDADRAKMQADSAMQRSLRDNEREAAQKRAEKAVGELLTVARPAPADATYLLNKGARADGLRAVPADTTGLPTDSIILIGKSAKESKALRLEHPDNLVFTAGDLLLTAHDANDVIKSVQSIRPNGTKMFAKGTEKHGHFHVTGGGGVKSLEAAPVIVVSEGYATADTASQLLGYPTVAAFDSGNLPNVGRQLRERFPDKPMLFAGDNDKHLEICYDKNPGRDKAGEAATDTGGVAIWPVFAQGEQEYPSELEPIEPEKAKLNQLTDSQQEGLNAMKKFTDFNDMALKSKLGREGAERQLRTGIAMAVKAHEERVASIDRSLELGKTQSIEEPLKRRSLKL